VIGKAKTHRGDAEARRKLKSNGQQSKSKPQYRETSEGAEIKREKFSAAWHRWEKARLTMEIRRRRETHWKTAMDKNFDADRTRFP